MFKRIYFILISGIASIALVTLDYIGTDKLCGGRQYTECMQNLHSLIIVLFPILSVFIFSLFILWMHDEVYQAWFKFARWWIPISMLLIFITPEYGGGLFNPISKGSVAFLLSGLFFFISLVIILLKSIRSRY